MLVAGPVWVLVDNGKIPRENWQSSWSISVFSLLFFRFFFSVSVLVVKRLLVVSTRLVSHDTLCFQKFDVLV